MKSTAKGMLKAYRMEIDELHSQDFVFPHSIIQHSYRYPAAHE